MTIQSDVRLAIIQVLNTLPEVGMVYDHYKYSSDWTRFLDQFGWINTSGIKQIRGSWISIPTVRRGTTTTFDQKTDLYNWPLRSIMSFSDRDESEKDFEDLIYLIRSTLVAELNFGESVVIPGFVEVDIDTVDIRTFGSVLCHYAQFNIMMEAQST